MAFGNKLYGGYGLSPEDERMLRRQLFSQMGSSLLSNALAGGSWAGLGSALAPLGEAPERAMELAQYRQRQAEEEQQKRARELAIRIQMAQEGRARSDQEQGDTLFRQGQTDRQEAMRREDIASLTEHETLDAGFVAREKAVKEAEAVLAGREKALGPNATALHGQIDALRTRGDVTPDEVADWKRSFYAAISSGEVSERTASRQARAEDLAQRRESRLEASADSRNLHVVTHEGVTTIINKVTGEETAAIHLQSGERKEVPAYIFREADEQAKAEILRTLGPYEQIPAQAIAKIEKRRADLIKQFMGQVGIEAGDTGELSDEALDDAFGIPSRLRRP